MKKSLNTLDAKNANKINSKKFNLKDLGKKARIFNSYCLPILTVYPGNAFKRQHYLPEMVINMPEKYHSLISKMNSPYMKTLYLKKEEAEEYRLFVNNGLIVSLDTQSGKIVPYSTGASASMVVLTEDGKLFSAKKKEDVRLQHTSFNRAGYMLFAGYWKTEEGKIKTIVAQSGHYEPSVASLQNFVRFLTYSECKLIESEFIFANRRFVPSLITGDFVLDSQYENYNYEQLAGVKIETIKLFNTLITPRNLNLIDKQFFEERQSNLLIVTQSNAKKNLLLT